MLLFLSMLAIIRNFGHYKNVLLNYGIVRPHRSQRIALPACRAARHADCGGAAALSECLINDDEVMREVCVVLQV